MQRNPAVLERNSLQPRIDTVAERFERSMRVPESFLAAHTGPISKACLEMARRFHRGGRLIAFGNGGWASDAQHVAVEFVHPVIVGKRALPALSLTNDGALLTGVTASQGGRLPFERQLSLIARRDDIAMGFSMAGCEPNILDAFQRAAGRGLLTIALTGSDPGDLGQAALDFCFAVPSDDPMVVQETHETLYHILWELVHVFFEHEGLLA